MLSGRIQNHDEVVTLPSATQPLTSSLSVILHPPYDFGPFLHFEPPAQFPCHLFGNREVPQSHPMHCLTRIPRYIVHSHHTEALLGDTAITGHPVTVSKPLVRSPVLEQDAPGGCILAHRCPWAPTLTLRISSTLPCYPQFPCCQTPPPRRHPREDISFYPQH